MSFSLFHTQLLSLIWLSSSQGPRGRRTLTMCGDALGSHKSLSVSHTSRLIVTFFSFSLVFQDRVSLYSPGCPGTHFVGWPRTQKYACLCLSGAKIKDISRHTWLTLYILKTRSIFISYTLHMILFVDSCMLDSPCIPEWTDVHEHELKNVLFIVKYHGLSFRFITSFTWKY